MKPLITLKEKFVLFLLVATSACALSLPGQSPLRGSITEDRKAKKLLEAGDSRMEADEKSKALEIWRTVLDQFPKSKVRFEAHMRIGEYLLTSKGAFDEARKHFESAAAEENADDVMRARATLKQGVCFYEARLYGKCFKVFRTIIEEFPASEEVNRAYYYIGLGHFKQGHYSRAIESLEKVGTAFSEKEKGREKVEAGKRLFVKIEDADLAILAQEDVVEIVCRTKRGDEETLACRAIGRNARIVLGSISTQLGSVKKGNGILEVGGGDKVDVLYLDKHTAAKKFDVRRLKEVQVVGQGKASIMDGSYRDSLRGVVLGKVVNLQVNDPDWDLSPKPDALKVTVEVRRSKTPEEIDEEIANLVASGAIAEPAEGEEPYDPFSDDGEGPKIDKFKTVDSVVASLQEAAVEQAAVAEGNESASADGREVSVPADLVVDDSVHSGIFRGVISVENSEEAAKDQKLQAVPGDFVRVVYEDKLNVSQDPRKVVTTAKCIEGNVGGVRVTKTRIDDEELRLRTELKTAAALAEIGNHYKEFGLAEKAKAKYREAIAVGEETAKSARKLRGRILEESYVGLWKIYFAMENYGAAAAMSRRLQNEFPESPFVDDAILQQASVAKERGDLKTAIALFRGLTSIKNSELRGEGQFGIAECYEQMALAAGEGKGQGYFEQAFRAYQGVYENYPDSGRVGDAVAKMANFYYKKKDYRRAIDVFENVMEKHPDAGFLDVILFNYGRCLYRVDRKGDARRRFDQIINEYPDSNLAGEAKRISEALAKAGH
ncbi:MAG: tetratricopeptide repeat protein [Verrucomicrobiota bacterium]|nr:tetratricopeptide repeat protein [Verrucomicrobiota bacterium]